MNIVIKSAVVIDDCSPFNGQKVDIQIENGRIIDIQPKIVSQNNESEISGKSLFLTKSLVDINVMCSEPNNESAETLNNLLEAAEKGGVGHVAVHSNSHSTIASKSDVKFYQNQNSTHATSLIPVGDIIQKNQPKLLSEMYDMFDNGTVLFFNGNEMGLKSDILSNALQYAKSFGGKIMIHCENHNISKNGQVNQGIHSIYTGFKGIPNEAEFMAIEEAIHIAQYTNSPIIVANISTKEGVALIANAKKNNLKIKASTASFYLLMDDQNILEYDTNYKTNPPLRSKEDVEAVRKAVLDGTIDILYSQHTARTEEEKNLEFDLASFGIINIQTYLIAMLEQNEPTDYPAIIKACTDHPAEVLNMTLPNIDKGSQGKFTLIDMGDSTRFDKNQNASKSQNSPYLHKTMNGKIKALFTPTSTKIFN